jgi:hypothetical protein
MDSSSLEVRAISRAAAVLIALSGATLLATVRLPAAPSPGYGEAASLRVIRKKTDDEVAMAAAQALTAQQGAAFASDDDSAGLGEEVLLWVNAPGGQIVFRNADRYHRCVMARNERMEAPDCPSASDTRRMVLDTSRGARGA